MTLGKGIFRRKPNARELRMLFYLLVVVGIAAWRFIPRPWHPTLTKTTPYHIIYSTATPQQTDATAHALELLHVAYSNRLGTLPNYKRQPHLLKVKLFRDRTEFRRINPGLGWAEAFYLEPYCRAYYSAEETNPFHWMLHESVHQLNHEVAQLKLEKWLEEGLGEYLSTSQLRDNELLVGQIDPNTYPVWWIDDLATTASLEENTRNGSIIPLRKIITNRGGPGMNQHFNLYYLHWWTLTHFVFEHPEYRNRAQTLVERGGGLEAFEQVIGPLEKVEAEWHEHIRHLKARLAGTNLRPNRTQDASAKN